jgi:NADH dehydrogenase
MRNVVVIGSGFAGMAAVKRLERDLPHGWRVILVSEENYISFSPLLPEVVGASLLPGHAVAPLRLMVRRGHYYCTKVEWMDPDRRVVSIYADRSYTISYDHLVIACGNVPNLGMIDGMDRHALPLKTLGDALHIRNRVFAALERAELEDGLAACRRLSRFLVIGGGSSGVEVAGAIADLLRVARRYYPRLREDGYQVTLIEAGERLLVEFPSSLGEAALRHMRDNGIAVHLQTKASLVGPHGVRIDGNQWLEADTIICTIGTAPHPLVSDLKLATEKGLIATNPDMSVKMRSGIWAAGDCAFVINALNNEQSPPTAQFAVREGRQLARNIVRTINGKKTRAFRYRPRGELATIGHRRAVAHVLGLRLSGFPAWLLWRALYLMMMPTLLRKLQVFSEWGLSLAFPRDMTQLHLARSGEKSAAEDGKVTEKRRALS